jgi:MFS family permease
MMIFSAAPFIGPVAGPLFSGFINQQQPDWRWTYYVILIWAGCMMALLVAFVPETFDPKLLKKKAKK